MFGNVITFLVSDQDSAMAAAIKRVFKKTQDRLCRWHMLKKYRNELKNLESVTS